MSPMREKDNIPDKRYLERGQEAGHDLDDWLQAEREIDEGSV